MPSVWTSGSLSLLEPSGPVQARNGTALPFMRSRNSQNVCKYAKGILTNSIRIFALRISKIQFDIDLYVEISTDILSDRLFSNKILYKSVHTFYKPRPSHYSNIIVTTYFWYYKALIFTDFLPPPLHLCTTITPFYKIVKYFCSSFGCFMMLFYVEMMERL